MEYIKNIESTFNKTLENPWVMTALKLALVLYTSQISPKAPEFYTKMFENTYFKIFGIAIIIYLTQRDLQLSIIMAVAFVVGMNVISGRRALESFEVSSKKMNMGKYTRTKLADVGKNLLEPSTFLYPGCIGIKMEDIVKIFEEKNLELQSTVDLVFIELLNQMKTKSAKEKMMAISKVTGIPGNVNWDDPKTPAYIATMLINYGFKINGKCQAPK